MTKEKFLAEVKAAFPKAIVEDRPFWGDWDFYCEIFTVKDKGGTFTYGCIGFSKNKHDNFPYKFISSPRAFVDQAASIGDLKKLAQSRISSEVYRVEVELRKMKDQLECFS